MTLFSVQQHSFRSIMEQLNKWRKEDMLCDVTLKTASGNISAHRCILAAYSSYFSSMFMMQFSEKDKHVIDMSEVTKYGEEFSLVIDAMYTGTIEISEENVLVILHLSSFLLWDEVKSFCVAFMHNHMALEQCVSYYIGSQFYEMSRLRSHAETILLSRFHDYFIFDQESLQLPPNVLLHLVSLNIQKFCQMTEFLIFLYKWCEYDRSDEKFASLCCLFDKISDSAESHSDIQTIQLALQSVSEENKTLKGQMIFQVLNDIKNESEKKKCTEEVSFSSDHDSPSPCNNLEAADNPSCIWQVIHEAIMKRDTKPDKVYAAIASTSASTALSIPDSLKNIPRDENKTSAIIVVAPSGDTVKKWFGLDKYATCSISCREISTGCYTSPKKSKPPASSKSDTQALCISAYIPSKKTWYFLGNYSEDLVPGGFLHHQNSCHWRIAFFRNKLYFFSNLFKLGFTLDPRHNCVHAMPFPSSIENDLDGTYRFAIPTVVNKQLYLLALQARYIEDDKLYHVTYQYFLLLSNNNWMKISEIKVTQTNVGTPYLYCSNNSIFLLSLEKGSMFVGQSQSSLHTIGKGHIFDAVKKDIIQEIPSVIYHFRIPNIGCILLDNILNIFDGGNLALKYFISNSSWEFVGLENIVGHSLCPLQYRIEESCYPVCKNLIVSYESDMYMLSSSEYYQSDMLNAVMGNDLLPAWKICTPPPFLYFTAATAGNLNASDIQHWKTSRFVHT